MDFLAQITVPSQSNGIVPGKALQYPYAIVYQFPSQAAVCDNNVFLLSSKTTPFEQYYRLHLSGPNIAICETKSNNVFVLTHTSFDQNNFYFLHAVQEAVDAINEVLKDFGFFQRLAPYDPSKHQTQPNPATHTQNFQPGFL